MYLMIYPRVPYLGTLSRLVTESIVSISRYSYPGGTKMLTSSPAAKYLDLDISIPALSK